MNQKKFNEILVKRYLDNNLTPDELELFFHLTAEGEINDELIAAMDDEVIGLTNTERKLKTPTKYKIWFRIAAAASVILCVTFSVYFLNQDRKPVQISQKTNSKQSRNKAVLTLDNGSQLILDNISNGLLANEGNTNISKINNGQISYQSIKIATPSTIKYNTLSTPKGGEYQITLEDGTKVWLNAYSSIRFPTSFGPTERSVEIKGEVYFEVAKNRLKPFIVNCNGQKVEVLGTHFNINAYSDEELIKTTLLEGSVKVFQTLTGTSKVLKPGQQAQIHNKKTVPSIFIANANTEAVVAWKDGYFMFEREGLQNIMRKLGRWYDVDIIYKGPINDTNFGGTISKFNDINDVLEVLEATGSVHFKIEGRRITVMP